MRGKKFAILCSTAPVLMSTWLPINATTLTTLTFVGGTALVAGCSADRSDSRQDARTEARTSERTEQRVEDRHD